MRYLVVIDSLGLLSADQYLHLHLKALIQHLKNDLQVEQRYREFGFIAADRDNDMEGVLTEKDILRATLHQIDTILAKHTSLNPINPDLFVSHSSVKLQTLVEALRSQWIKSSDSCQCIIFVSQRHIATSMSWLLSNHPGCKDWLRPAVLMGHGEEDMSKFARGMTIKEQNQVRKHFKDKHFNLCA